MQKFLTEDAAPSEGGCQVRRVCRHSVDKPLGIREGLSTFLLPVAKDLAWPFIAAAQRVSRISPP